MRKLEVVVNELHGGCKVLTEDLEALIAFTKEVVYTNFQF